MIGPTRSRDRRQTLTLAKSLDLSGNLNSPRAYASIKCAQNGTWGSGQKWIDFSAVNVGSGNNNPQFSVDAGTGYIKFSDTWGGGTIQLGVSSGLGAWTLGAVYGTGFTFTPMGGSTAVTMTTSELILNTNILRWKGAGGGSIYVDLTTEGSSNLLSQQNGVNAQTFRVYNTYTGSTSHEFLQIRGVASANFEIGPRNGSAGGTLRGLTIGGYALGSATITGWLQFRPNATTAALEAFYLGPIADSTTVGGNARGTGAVDLQTSRTAAAQVVSGDTSFSAGINNTVSGARSGAVGSTNSVSGANSFAVGFSNVVSQSEALAFGNTHSVAHSYSIATGLYGKTQFSGERVMSLDSYNGQGGAQLIEATNKQRSTSATPVNWDLPIASGRTYHFQILVAGVKSDGSAIACYTRRVSAKNVAGTVTIVNNQTIGTDYEDNASADVAVTASTTNVRISVTGIAAETWRWQFALHGVEIEYGT